MGLFWLDYKNVPGQGVYAQGGLKFRFTEETLKEYFGPILSYVSLNDLIGEAVFWTMLPTYLAVYIFPFILYYKGILVSIVTAAVVFLIAEIYHLSFYNKPLNYLAFFLGSTLPQSILYAVFLVLFIRSGSVAKIAVLVVQFLASFLGIYQVFAFIIDFPLVIINRAYFQKTKEFLFLPSSSDQILINIGRYYAKKFRIDLTNR
jgi:hypothetical protein